jgi:hypothetical protein
MNDALNRRCALYLLVAMTSALAVGLLALGPMPIPSEEHHHAGDDTRFGHAVNVFATLPLFAAAWLGWRTLPRTGWSMSVRRPWAGCFLFAMAMSLASAAYHLAPDHAHFVVSNIVAAGAFMLLLAGFLAERVSPAFGTRRALVAVVAAVAAAGAFTAWSLWRDGTVDLRPLLLMQMLPALLIPAGALSLNGRFTQGRNWALMLGAYLLARACDFFDGTLLDLVGIGGHAVMHLGFALTLGGLAHAAYRASRKDVGAAGASRPSSFADGDSHFSTSLNTTG